VYQYHPLFRDFLLAKAHEVMTHEEIAETRMNGAKLLEQAGQIEEAFSLFTEEKSWADCIRLILVNAQSYMEKGRMHTLQEWIQSIPEGIRENVPWLLYWLATCKQPFNPHESRILFERAFHIFEESGELAGTWLSWSGAVNSIIHAWDNLKYLDFWLDWFEQKKASGIIFPSEEIEAIVAASVASILYWRMPDHPDKKMWVDRAIVIAQKIQNANIIMQIYPQAIMFLNSTGLFNDARNVFNGFKGISQSIRVNPLIIITNKFAESQFYSSSAITDDKSIQAVEDGLKAAQKYGIHVWDVGLYCQGALSSLNLQDLHSAGKFIDKIESVVDIRQRNAYAYYLYLKAWYCLLVGNETDALIFGKKSLQITVETGSPTPEMCTRSGLIQILYAAGFYEMARNQLSIVDTINKRIKNPFFEYICNLVKAQFAMRNEDETSAKGYLHIAMELGGIHKYFTMVHFWVPSVLAKLCRKALDWDIEVEYVQELIRALKLVPDEPPYETENWPYPLKLYTLGRFSLIKEGKPIKFTGKVQHRPLALLKAIIAFGGREVDQNQVIDALWPEAAGDVAYSSYKIAMHRLRQLIGKEEAVQVGEGRVTLDPRFCWVDVWAFQRLSGQVEQMWKTTKNESETEYLVGLSEKAIALYKGDFLTGDAMEPWTVSMREKLKNRFIQIVVRLCEHFEGSEQWDKAALYCGKGLEIDDLAEEFYQRLMTCYTRLGRQTDALSVYTRCCKVLHAAMGIEPSPKTVAIYRAITADANVQN
jgi:DNA-binding SARP family transcriptional activator